MDRVLSPDPGTGEIYVAPQLLDPDGGKFSLHGNSPCIDEGNPASEFNDPDGTRNDMGALFYDQNDSATEKVTWGKLKALYR